MKDFELRSVSTNAEINPEDGKLIQWAEIKLVVLEGFDWEKNGAQVIKKLRAASELIGRG